MPDFVLVRRRSRGNMHTDRVGLPSRLARATTRFLDAPMLDGVMPTSIGELKSLFERPTGLVACPHEPSRSRVTHPARSPSSRPHLPREQIGAREEPSRSLLVEQASRHCRCPREEERGTVMATPEIATAGAAQDVNLRTLKLGPVRLLTFLQGAADPAVRAQLVAIGWSEQDAEDAWSLLNRLRGPTVTPSPVNPVPAAFAACEEWHSTWLTRMRVLLQMTHPDQARFLFHDLTTARGLGAVIDLSAFLERRERLDNDPHRNPTRTADHQALAIIARAGATPEMRKRWRAAVDTVHSPTDAGTDAEPQLDDGFEAQRLETLRKIWVWITTWSEIARTGVTRRDHLIRLGIAKRRARQAPQAVTA
jgi:hypothetical protein